jgi:hypothetical protein
LPAEGAATVTADRVRSCMLACVPIAAPAANPRRPSDDPDSTNAWSDARPLWRTVCS